MDLYKVMFSLNVNMIISRIKVITEYILTLLTFQREITNRCPKVKTELNKVRLRALLDRFVYGYTAAGISVKKVHWK